MTKSLYFMGKISVKVFTILNKYPILTPTINLQTKNQYMLFMLTQKVPKNEMSTIKNNIPLFLPKYLEINPELNDPTAIPRKRTEVIMLRKSSE